MSKVVAAATNIARSRDLQWQEPNLQTQGTVKSIICRYENPRRLAILTIALVTVLTLALVTNAVGQGAPVAAVYKVVPEQSRASIKVGKAGALSFAAGHAHEVEAPIRGTVTVDPARPEAGAITIEIDAAALKVTGEGEPPADVPKVQERMLSADVLDVARYPTITFRSTALKAGSQRGAAIDLSVTGELTLHGQTKPFTVPVHVELTTDKIAARGTFSVKQSDFGMSPISVGGVVSVRDELTIRVAILAVQAIE